MGPLSSIDHGLGHHQRSQCYDGKSFFLGPRIQAQTAANGPIILQVKTEIDSSSRNYSLTLFFSPFFWDPKRKSPKNK